MRDRIFCAGLLLVASAASARVISYSPYTDRVAFPAIQQRINRFFALDTRSYETGALPVKTKELLGLVASMVLRCDDCVTYHMVRCREEGVTDPEFFDAFAVALVVGGSIVIPHLRRAVARLEELPAK